MTGGRIGYGIAHFNMLAIAGVLTGALGVQFVRGELPCPLCMLQRTAMLLCALGPAFIVRRAHRGPVEPADFAAGYGMSVLAAVLGASIAGRQVLLHIQPGDAGFGEPVLGLHLYTWSFVVFATVLVDAGVNLTFAASLAPQQMESSRVSKAVLGVILLLIMVNGVAVFFEEGLHWTLPDDPTHYRLFEDLGWRAK